MSYWVRQNFVRLTLVWQDINVYACVICKKYVGPMFLATRNGHRLSFRAMLWRRTARRAVRRVWTAKSGGPNTAPEEGVRLAW